MTILPLIARELRVRARNPGTFWARFAVVLVGLLFCLPTFTMSAGPATNKALQGSFAFSYLVMIAFTLGCLVGLLTVNGVTRDRREGTLGLLFLTSVRPLDVLLASFGSMGISCLCALIALVPLFILPILAGGVTGGEAARTTLVLFDTMCVSVAVGLFCSASGRGWFNCARLALVLLAVILFAPMMAIGVPGISWISPVLALRYASDATYRHDPFAYWASLVAIQLISWLLLFAAGCRLKRAMREEDAWQKDSAAPRSRKALADGENPILWLLRPQRALKAAVWLGPLCQTVYFLPGLAPYFGFRANPAFFPQSGSFAVHWFRQCVFAWAASHFFIEARRSGEIELLLTTPLAAKTLVASLWQSLRGLFFWPTIILVAPVFALLVAFVLSSEAHVWGSRVTPILFDWPIEIIYILGTFVSVVTTIWLGLWFGFHSRSQGRAVLMVLILADGGPFVIGSVFRAIVHPAYGYPPRFWPSLLVSMPQILSIFYGLCLIAWAWRRLSSELPQSDPVFGFLWDRRKSHSLASLVYKTGD